MSEVRNTETFRPIPGFPAYQVSNWGNLLTCYCPNGWAGMTDVWRPLSPSPQERGYLYVKLQRDGKAHHRYIHRLVLEVFVGPCPRGMEACHFPDRDPANNRLANLRWGTPQSNARDKLTHGTQVRGEQCWKAKLTEEKIVEMRKMREQGLSCGQIAAAFGITPTRVSKVVLGDGQTWRHISPAADVREQLRQCGRVCGEKNRQAKLDGVRVTAIRSRHAQGEKLSELARAFGVSKSTVHRVVTRRHWGHVA